MTGVIIGADGVARCSWGSGAPDYAAYHDEEWGRQVRGEQALYERLMLEAFQSGLSWLTILRKRPAFRAAFAGFVPDTVARFTDAAVERLMQDASIVRNRRKIEATIRNARAVVGLREQGGLDSVILAHAPARHARPADDDAVPASTRESAALAAALKKAGFAHVGPTTCYSLLQACGFVNDHVVGCTAGDAIDALTTPADVSEGAANGETPGAVSTTNAHGTVAHDRTMHDTTRDRAMYETVDAPKVTA